MRHNTDTGYTRRRVEAPVSGMSNEPSPILSVLLEEDEDVVWQWSHYANGQSVVSGYEVIKKEEKEEEEEAFDIKQAITEWLWAGSKEKKV
jgi:hypothetical protein